MTDAAERTSVYVIGAARSGVVKIGFSTNVASRLRSIQSTCPLPLSVLWTHRGDRKLETALHRRFAEFRAHGEWFDFGAEDPIQAIASFVGDLLAGRIPPKPRKYAGRPAIGGAVLVRLGPLLPRVDAFAARQGVSRAEAIRRLVSAGLEVPARLRV